MYFLLTQSSASDTPTQTVGYICAVNKESVISVSSIVGYPEAYMPDKALVALEGNASTGYTWSYTMSAEGILSQDAAVARATYGSETSEALVGAGETENWVFTGQTEGDVTLTFTYAQAWDTEAEPAQTVTYTYHVDENLNVSLTQTGDAAVQTEAPAADETPTPAPETTEDLEQWLIVDD